MGVTYWWIGYLIDDEDHARIQPRFEAARRAAAPYLAAQQFGIEAWRANPADLLKSFPGDHTTRSAFWAAFMIPSYVALFGGDLGYLNREEVVFRFSILNKDQPVMVLWQALGYERARALPGDMGNLLVARTDVDRVLGALSPVFRDLDEPAAMSRARRLTEASTSDEDISKVITFLPDGLRRARELGKGFFSLALMAP